MKSYSLNYYIIICSVLFIISISTIIKVFVDNHPLKFIFVLLFIVGLFVGYFRYLMRKKRDAVKQRSKYQRFGILLLFILIYMGIKTGVREFVSSEVSSQDYGIVLAFFILGLFISYYALYSFYLWNLRKMEKIE
ncbi:hypothetical protein U5N28_18895 [Lysinibacillus telephonicus]|uniref:Uncharacterized protein n=1 Tax=Lysinibacillus telephonicus TaxID=1714840 RepID=A0A3S0HBY6_9BACI|nr:hypothetical protein [Lysinibacillus telephonicus]RTQ87572.1 hypothetical protein EKG35_18905 [Lysinibacillus telephonicus]